MRQLPLPLYGLTFLALFFTGCAASSTKPIPILETVPSGDLTWVGELPVLHLSGSPYQMGYQQGSLLRSEVRASVKNAMAFVNGQSGIPVIGRLLARQKLDHAWKQMAPFVPSSTLEELQGLSDGAGVPLKDLQRVHALPELMATTCASFAAFGKATQGGRLIQVRNLDWAIQSDVQRYAAIFVYHPREKHSFVSIGWLGFIGVISGIGEGGISVGEIGAKTQDASLEGIPMPFLLKEVLEESDDLREAVSIVQTASRTGGYNYLFADASRAQAVALETTRSRCAVFWADQEPDVPFGLEVHNAIFRSDWALDPDVRDLQRASRGDPSRPGLESPLGSSAYDVRYRGQGQLLLKFHGVIDPEIAMAIARAIAPSSNIQSVVYAFPELWVANSKERQPAAMGRYIEVNLEDLLKR